MQAASGRSHRDIDLPFREGCRLLHLPFVHCFRFLLGLGIKMNPGRTPLALLALLLFGAPLVLTLQKFVALLTFGDDSHQLAVQPAARSLSDFCHPTRSFSSFIIPSVISTRIPLGIGRPLTSASSILLRMFSHLAKALF